MTMRICAPLVALGLATVGCGDRSTAVSAPPAEPMLEAAGASPAAGTAPVALPHADPREAAKAEALRGLTFADGRLHADSAEAVAIRSAQAATDAPALVERGLADLRRNVPLEAIRSIARAVVLAPAEAGSYAALGDALLRQKGWEDKARDAFRTGVELAPESVELHTRLADAQWRLGESEAAQASWERALELDPDGVEARVRLARASFLLGQDERAWHWIHSAEALGSEVPAQMRGALAQRSPEPAQVPLDRSER